MFEDLRKKINSKLEETKKEKEKLMN